jgi:hypothetical protein
MQKLTSLQGLFIFSTVGFLAFQVMQMREDVSGINARMIPNLLQFV